MNNNISSLIQLSNDEISSVIGGIDSTKLKNIKEDALVVTSTGTIISFVSSVYLFGFRKDAGIHIDGDGLLSACTMFGVAGGVMSGAIVGGVELIYTAITDAKKKYSSVSIMDAPKY